ncbi:DUF106 domain-containing protein [Candidatus Woesearchaeota archaeon]|nr:DUF106 domain-containing protein [Candidatus Woesearchaeota archaeon]
MGFFSFLDPIFDTIFGPLLVLDPFYFVLIVSAVLSLFIVIIYKYTTNQSLMKALKQEIKELQAEMKALKGHPDKMMEVNKRMMATNSKYMMQSLKASLFTLLPIIIIYAYLSGVIAYDPIMPGQEFSMSVVLEEGVVADVETSVPVGLEVTGDDDKRDVDDEAIFTYKGRPGRYLVQFDVDDKTYGHEVLVTEERKHLPAEKSIEDGTVNMIHTNLDKTIVMNLFGWELGWFGSYIIFSIVFSILFRRLLKVY